MSKTNMLKKICPICVLVGGTWIVLLSLRFFGYEVSESFVALLMGGSVVGISYTLGKRTQGGLVMVWKILSIPVGFAAAWALLHFAWSFFMLAAAAYALFFMVMREKSGVQTAGKKSPIDITKELEDCCDE